MSTRLRTVRGVLLSVLLTLGVILPGTAAHADRPYSTGYLKFDSADPGDLVTGTTYRVEAEAHLYRFMEPRHDVRWGVAFTLFDLSPADVTVRRPDGSPVTVESTGDSVWIPEPSSTVEWTNPHGFWTGLGRGTYDITIRRGVLAPGAKTGGHASVFVYYGGARQGRGVYLTYLIGGAAPPAERERPAAPAPTAPAPAAPAPPAPAPAAPAPAEAMAAGTDLRLGRTSAPARATPTATTLPSEPSTATEGDTPAAQPMDGAFAPDSGETTEAAPTPTLASSTSTVSLVSVVLVAAVLVGATAGLGLSRRRRRAG